MKKRYKLWGVDSWHRSAGLALALCLLCACQSQSPRADTQPDSGVWPDLASTYAVEDASVYRLDAALSTVRIYVYRAGKAARLGHNHVLSLPRFEGAVRIPGDQPGDADCDLRLKLEDIVVDDPALRAVTGGAFTSERSVEDIAGTRRNMLSDKGLDAEHFPQMRLRCARVTGDWPQLIVQMEVTLHGIRRTEPVALQVERTAQKLRVQGALILRQSDYGITPLSALGGLMTVQDEVLVRFDLHGAAFKPSSHAGGES